MRVSRDPADIAIALAQIGKPRRTVKPPPTDVLVTHCRLLKLPVPVLELKFHPSRRWRFDACWPDLKLALEIEGVTYQGKTGKLGGRHVSASGFREDAVKYGEAFALGWTVVRCLPEQVTNGQAADWLARRLRAAEPKGL